jgi:hypothetical protein
MKKRDGEDMLERMRPGRFRTLSLFIMLSLACAPFGFGQDNGQAPREESRLQSVSIDGHFDPERDFLEATATLRFSQPAGDQCIWLAEELQLKSAYGGGAPVTEIQRDSDLFQVRRLWSNELELRYSGKIVPSKGSFASSWKKRKQGEAAEYDDFKVLSYITDFYPHAQFDFIAMKVNARVPDSWNCLGSGTLSAVRSDPETRTFTFTSPKIKGMSLVFGRFQQLGWVPATALVPGMIPARVHGWPGFRYQRYFNDHLIARLIAFYTERFGPLDVPELNILIRRGCNFHGVSSSGLVIMDVDQSWPQLLECGQKALEAESPLSMIDAETDLLAHEIAHQWWGGLVSWNTTSDNWLTEGLATYSSLLYTRKFKGEKAFRKICERLRRRMKSVAKLGAPADGIKLKLMNSDVRTYQILVYGKPALMLVELADRIGEDEVIKRLRGILQDHRYSNIDASKFLERLANGDEGVKSRLLEWIRDTGLPKG